MAPCYRCKSLVPVNHFYPDKHKASGRSSICIPCELLKQSARYEKVKIEPRHSREW